MPEPKVSELHFLFSDDDDSDSGGFPLTEELVIWKVDEEEHGCCFMTT